MLVAHSVGADLGPAGGRRFGRLRIKIFFTLDSMGHIGFSVLFVTLFAILLMLQKVGLPTAFFFTAVFAHQTSLANDNISTAMILVACVLFAAGSRLDLLGRSSVKFLAFSAVCVGLTMLSTMNHSSAVQALGKAGKLALAFAPLFLPFRRNDRALITIINTFAWVSLIGGLLQVLLYGGQEGVYGLPRFSGFMDDSNYFGSLILLLLVYLDRHGARGRHQLRRRLLFLLLLTQSATILTFTTIYLCQRWLAQTRRRQQHARAGRPARAVHRAIVRRTAQASHVLLAMAPIIIASAWVGGAFYIQMAHGAGHLFNDQGNFIAMKVNSFLFRLLSQFQAVDMMISDSKLLLFGYGSGNSVELFGRTQHNLYMQILFDNGIFTLILLLGLLATAARRLSHVPFVYLFLLFANCLFDTVMMFVFSFALFLFASAKPWGESWT